MRNHLRPNRIHFDIALAPQEVALGIDDAGAKTALEKRTGSARRAVHVLDESLAQVLHQYRRGIRSAGCE
jgi:hypothetical protein